MFESSASAIFDRAEAPCHTVAMITPDEQNTLIAAHNDWRARYNTPPLAWDANLAAVAQNWADQMAASGNFDHRPDNQFGENISMGTSGAFPAKAVVDGWGAEDANFDRASLTCAPGAECGHFTQVVWAQTARVGCGKATGSDGNDYWVCNYDPAGNMAGASPFV
jgi:pathogenesis-related protein 1